MEIISLHSDASTLQREEKYAKYNQNFSYKHSSHIFLPEMFEITFCFFFTLSLSSRL